MTWNNLYGLNLPNKTIADIMRELEAEIEKLKAEQIDMLLHPEKYFSIYRDVKTVYKRAERLEAENAALKTELDRALSINNPCLHTGLESFVCEVCGYPDPRKVIAALRTERDNTCKRAEELGESQKRSRSES